MKLFRKKDIDQKCQCSNFNSESMIQAKTSMNSSGIKVLGSNCAKCQSLEEAVKNALNELNLNLSVEHITDFSQIALYGVMTTPALVINGKVVSYGKVLTKEEAKSLILKEEK